MRKDLYRKILERKLEWSAFIRLPGRWSRSFHHRIMRKSAVIAVKDILENGNVRKSAESQRQPFRRRSRQTNYAGKCGKMSKVFRRKYSRSGKKSEVHSLRRIPMWNCRRARSMSRGWIASGTGKRSEQRRTVQIRTAGFPKELPALKNLFSEGRVFQTDETSYSYRSGRGKRFCLLEDAGVSFLYLF